MDNRLKAAKLELLTVEEKLKAIYPGLVSVGTPCYTLPPRISFSMKFDNGRRRVSLASRLILEASLGRRLGSNETCDHIDGDPTNDCLSNLQILTRQDNARKGPSEKTKHRVLEQQRSNPRAYRPTGLRGEANKQSKLTDAQAAEIKLRLASYTRGLASILAQEYNVSRELISAIKNNKVRAY